MTVPIGRGSSRHVAAQAFAAELRKAMAARKASSTRLSEASGCMKSSIWSWRTGSNLPQPATAARLAEALDWPRLLAIATDARRKSCGRCGMSYVDATGAGNRMFCSADCRLIDEQLRTPTAAVALRNDVRAAADARLAGAPERETLPAILDAVHRYDQSDRRQRARVDAQDRRLRALTGAVDAMCRACEPEGVCRTAECPLRAFSPLPAASARPVTDIRAPEGAWGPSFRERTLVGITEASGRRWNRDGERERMSELMTSRHAAMTEDERADRGRRISEGRRRAVLS